MKINSVHTNKLINIYHKTAKEMFNQLLDIEKQNKQYHKFFVNIRLSLYNLSKSDKKYKPLFKRVDKFIKRWS